MFTDEVMSKVLFVLNLVSFANFPIKEVAIGDQMKHAVMN